LNWKTESPWGSPRVMPAIGIPLPGFSHAGFASCYGNPNPVGHHVFTNLIPASHYSISAFLLFNFSNSLTGPVSWRPVAFVGSPVCAPIPCNVEIGSLGALPKNVRMFLWYAVLLSLTLWAYNSFYAAFRLAQAQYLAKHKKPRGQKKNLASPKLTPSLPSCYVVPPWLSSFFGLLSKPMFVPAPFSFCFLLATGPCNACQAPSSRNFQVLQRAPKKPGPWRQILARSLLEKKNPPFFSGPAKTSQRHHPRRPGDGTGNRSSKRSKTSRWKFHGWKKRPGRGAIVLLPFADMFLATHLAPFLSFSLRLFRPSFLLFGCSPLSCSWSQPWSSIARKRSAVSPRPALFLVLWALWCPSSVIVPQAGPSNPWPIVIPNPLDRLVLAITLGAISLSSLIQTTPCQVCLSPPRRHCRPSLPCAFLTLPSRCPAGKKTSKRSFPATNLNRDQGTIPVAHHCWGCVLRRTKQKINEAAEHFRKKPSRIKPWQLRVPAKTKPRDSAARFPG